jgi:eukaryotic-like serine/threonine-protein kinase
MAIVEPAPTGYTGYDPFEGTSYCALSRLRAGGMGQVWLVEHRGTGRRLVAKMLHERLASDPKLVERLRREAVGTAQLNHHHIVKMLGVDSTKRGQLFIIMEYLQGRTLAEQLAADGALHVVQAVTYGCQLLSALAAAHAIGLVHRDVKPDNIFVCQPAEGPPYIKLLDFGVARVMPGSTAVEPLPKIFETRTGVVIGTPRFVSPEGAMGQRVDERADVYGAGLVLYNMLAGRGPFDHFEGDHMLLTAHAAEDPEPPSRLATEPVPPELDRAVLKALSKDPSQRFQTAEEFHAALSIVADQLLQPTGWLETSTFDAAAFRASAFGEAAATGAPVGSADTERLGPPAPATTVEPSAPASQASSGVRDVAPEPSVASSARGRPRSTLSQVIWFSIGLAIAGLAVLGFVTILEGRGP